MTILTRGYILDLASMNWIFSFEVDYYIFQVLAQYSQVIQQYLASIVTIRSS